MRTIIACVTVVLLTVNTCLSITVETVAVTNAGNPPNSSYPFLGDVSYVYEIGTYEVTNTQYVEFLNDVDHRGDNIYELYDLRMMSSSMGGILFLNDAPEGEKYATKPNRAEQPVVFVSWYDAARFANWLNTGTTEFGAYNIIGQNTTPLVFERNPKAEWFLPNGSEWYKAGYHKNDGATDKYWQFPTRSDSLPSSISPPGDAVGVASNAANIFRDDGVINGINDGFAVTGTTDREPTQNYLTDVGSYTEAIGPYGTFDQAGNVAEWTELPQRSILREVYGSDWHQVGGDNRFAAASFADQGYEFIGFRVARVPEPATTCETWAAVVLVLHGYTRLRAT